MLKVFFYHLLVELFLTYFAGAYGGTFDAINRQGSVESSSIILFATIFILASLQLSVFRITAYFANRIHCLLVYKYSISGLLFLYWTSVFACGAYYCDFNDDFYL